MTCEPNECRLPSELGLAVERQLLADFRLSTTRRFRPAAVIPGVASGALKQTFPQLGKPLLAELRAFGCASLVLLGFGAEGKNDPFGL
ncbi:hypothetical protein [Variovorax atrisoli]|uniref:hypothetical protein n=1 Tax=Variovorax atrisoli TaxID=3394203 RepID=UPI000478426C|nr:hypothetical protein [Variovorax paradoxus]